MDKYRPALAAGIVVCAGWFIWQIFIANRYQTLCQVHFWLATPSQIDSCKDMQKGLAGK